MRGVFVILCTPFDAHGNVDEPSLRREVQFCLQAEVHGVVTTANASEFWTLSDSERTRIVQVIVEETAWQVPVVAGVTAGSAWTSAMLAKQAQSSGVDALMAMPPMTGSVPLPAAYKYYRMLAGAVEIPIFIQNHEPPMGTRMPPEFIVRLISEIENVDFVKEETFPPGRAISAELTLAGPELKGIMGGIGARHVFDEHFRGTCGTMPACPWADLHVRVWNALESGDADSARALFGRLLPVMNLESMLGIPLYKVILQRRGIFATDFVRGSFGNPVDALERSELDRLIGDLQDVLDIAVPNVPA